MRASVVAGWVLALLPGVASAQSLVASGKVEVEYDHAADFAAYKTYAWAPFQDPAPNPADHIRVTRAVEHELEAKGFMKVSPDEASAFVRYQSRVDKKIVSTPSQSESPYQQPSDKRTMVSFGKVKVGTLVLELWDGHTKDMVWQARESGPEPPADRMEEAISKSVKRLLGEYPPKPAPAKKE
jgi:Domain of unknown function (DUF4136)